MASSPQIKKIKREIAAHTRLDELAFTCHSESPPRRGWPDPLPSELRAAQQIGDM